MFVIFCCEDFNWSCKSGIFKLDYVVLILFWFSLFSSDGSSINNMLGLRSVIFEILIFYLLLLMIFLNSFLFLFVSYKKIVKLRNFW